VSCVYRSPAARLNVPFSYINVASFKKPTETRISLRSLPILATDNLLLMQLNKIFPRCLNLFKVTLYEPTLPRQHLPSFDYLKSRKILDFRGKTLSFTFFWILHIQIIGTYEVYQDEDEDFLIIGFREPYAVIGGPQGGLWTESTCIRYRSIVIPKPACCSAVTVVTRFYFGSHPPTS
jgi:hypothetical protein